MHADVGPRCDLATFRAFVGLLKAQEGGTPVHRSAFDLRNVPAHCWGARVVDDDDSDDEDGVAPATSLLVAMATEMTGGGFGGDTREMRSKFAYLRTIDTGAHAEHDCTSVFVLCCCTSIHSSGEIDFLIESCLDSIDVNLRVCGTTALHAAAEGLPAACAYVPAICAASYPADVFGALASLDRDGFTPLKTSSYDNLSTFLLTYKQHSAFELIAELHPDLSTESSDGYLPLLCSYGLKAEPEQAYDYFKRLVDDGGEELVFLDLPYLVLLSELPVEACKEYASVMHDDRARRATEELLAQLPAMQPLTVALTTTDLDVVGYVYNNRSSAGSFPAQWAIARPFVQERPEASRDELYTWLCEHRLDAGVLPTLPRVQLSRMRIAFDGTRTFGLDGSKLPAGVLQSAKILYTAFVLARYRADSSKETSIALPHCTNPFMFTYSPLFRCLNKNILHSIANYLFPADSDDYSMFR